MTLNRMAQTYRNQIDRNMGSLDVTTNCSVCCGRNKELKTAHVHLSTAYYNRRMAAEKVDLPKRHFCDIEHGIDNMTRNRVVLSDTSLSGIQFLEEWSWGDVPPVHVDTECIEEASINTLRRAWERAYHSNPLPIDTVLVAGYHDISTLICQHSEKHTSESLTNLVTAEVIGAIRMLHNTIARHSEQYGVQDSLAVAPILHTPTLYWHKDDGKFPSPDYRNYAEMIDKINLKIEEYNVECGVSASPNFIKRAGERGLKNGRRIFRWDAWRECDKDKMCHLKDIHRISIMKKLVTYFMKATPPSIPIVPQ